MTARRRSRRLVGLAAALWIVFAFLVWNVIFDRMVVLAGRRYSYAATLAAWQGAPYLRINDWMRPAIAQSERVATIAALGVAALGLGLVWVAAKRARA